MTNAKIKEDQQRLNPGSALVTLYRIDATVLGGGVYYFTPGTDNNSPVYFNSIQYLPLPVEFEGLEQSKDGKMPRPTVRVSNITAILLPEIIQFNDLVGAKLVRTRTFAKYLDGHEAADPSAKFPDDVFYIEKKIRQNKYLVEWLLRSSLDVEYIHIPKRQCLSMCTHRYYGVDNPKSTCPYNGNRGYFTAGGTPTTKANDLCGKTLTDCRLRYSINDALPFKGFPGIGNFGVPYR